jgi:hypothetical protein
MPIDPAHCVDLANGKFAGTTAADVERLFEKFARDPNRDRLVVHFHGGLVNKAAGTATAERLLPVYEAAGGYPVFFVWHSGLLEVIAGNLGQIVQEAIFRRMRDLLTQLAIGKARAAAGERAIGLELPPVRDVRRAIVAQAAEEAAAPDVFAADEALLRAGDGRLTASQEALVIEQLQDDAILTQESLAIAATGRTSTRDTRGAGVAEPRATLMDEHVVAELQAEMGEGERGLISSALVARRAAGALKNVLARFAGGRDHGLYPTVVEELLRAFYLGQGGQIVWSAMKQDTRDAFGEDPRVHGGTAFLHGLRDRAQRGDDARTILVGHSTGAVYICEFLRHADAILPPDQTFEVVLLAPACTFDLLERTLEAHGHRIAGLRIFTMRDELERADRLVPAVYTRSLLYFVSGVVEDEPDMPIAGMHRFHVDPERFKPPAFASVENVRKYLAAKDGRVVWSKSTGRDGWSTTSRRHGDFDDDCPTLASVGHVITSGFG